MMQNLLVPEIFFYFTVQCSLQYRTKYHAELVSTFTFIDCALPHKLSTEVLLDLEFHCFERLRIHDIQFIII
jgi:hypothetical protein